MLPGQHAVHPDVCPRGSLSPCLFQMPQVAQPQLRSPGNLRGRVNDRIVPFNFGPFNKSVLSCFLTLAIAKCKFWIWGSGDIPKDSSFGALNFKMTLPELDFRAMECHWGTPQSLGTSIWNSVNQLWGPYGWCLKYWSIRGLKDTNPTSIKWITQWVHETDVNWPICGSNPWKQLH